MKGVFLVDVRRGDEIERYVTGTEDGIYPILCAHLNAPPLEYFRVEWVPVKYKEGEEGDS